LFGRPAYAFDEKEIVVFADARFDGRFVLAHPIPLPGLPKSGAGSSSLDLRLYMTIALL